MSDTKEFFIEPKVEIRQHDSDPHAGLRVYQNHPGGVAVQLRGSRGKVPTYAIATLDYSQLKQLRDWITNVLEVQS